MMKVFVVFLIFCGEALAIYSEMLGAKSYASANQTFLSVFFKMFLVMSVAGALLVAGYTIGYKAFQNIWVVSATSITSILIIEPALAYLVFHQLPTRGAFAGLSLGIIGLILALFWK